MPSLKHLISTKDIDRNFLDFFYHDTNFLVTRKWRFTEPKVLATLFFEPSTRTRLSFESAMLRLNGKCLGFADDQSTSIKKGETLSDTIRTICGYTDAIVIRHPIEGSARLASEVSMNVPVINAGDGSLNHPSQAIGDITTIANHFGIDNLDKLKVGYIGDLKYGRTVHSLVDLLANFDAEHFFLAPDPSLQIERDHLSSLINFNRNFHFVENTNEVIGKLDVLYVTRLQKERYPDPMEYDRIMKKYQINLDSLKNVKNNFIILHPLPRNNEIHSDVDKTPYAKYFEQAHTGVSVRMGLLYNFIERGGYQW